MTKHFSLASIDTLPYYEVVLSTDTTKTVRVRITSTGATGLTWIVYLRVTKTEKVTNTSSERAASMLTIEKAKWAIERWTATTAKHDAIAIKHGVTLPTRIIEMI